MSMDIIKEKTFGQTSQQREAVCFHAVEREGDEYRITGKDYARAVVCDEKTLYCNALDDGEKLSRLL